MNESRIKYTTYLAGAIEHTSEDEMTSWRGEVTEGLACNDLLIYDPVAQESKKVGKESGQQVDYIRGLKRAGKWELFFEEMWKIWFGNISRNSDLIQVMTSLRMTKHVHGNREDEMKHWGDFEAVVRSDFIVVYMPKDTKTVGTIYEVMMAFLFRIPVYLIFPDSVNTEANSSLIFGSQISNNEQVKTFYKVGDCIKYIQEKYNLRRS